MGLRGPQGQVPEVPMCAQMLTGSSATFRGKPNRNDYDKTANIPMDLIGSRSAGDIESRVLFIYQILGALNKSRMSV